MINEILKKLENKNIAILGFGKEGKSTYKFIRKYFTDTKLTIIDGLNKKDDDICKNDENVNFVYGKDYLNNLNKYDLIIKTPGISLNFLDKEYLNQIKPKITSQLELLLEVNSKNIIGITGTKGKSTTSTLLYNVIKDQGMDVILSGNIGIPVLDEIENYHDNTIIVVEMSSHQLEFIKTSPHIAAILNLYQDHLDHAGSLEHYHDNKLNIFRYQNESDFALYASDNLYTIEGINKLINNNQFNAIKYDVRFDDKDIKNNAIRLINKDVYIGSEIVYSDGNRKIIGDHNLKNIMFVLGICKILNLDFNKAKETITNFDGLEYRMEDLGIHDNIHFYVDTIATIPEATIGVLSSLSDIDTLLVGGENRNTDYTKLIDFLYNSDIKNIICMYDTGKIIYDALNNKNTNKNIYFTRDMREAYKISKDVTAPGKICILSPASSSKDVFNDYQEKGTLFKCLVNNIDTTIKEHGKELDRIINNNS